MTSPPPPTRATPASPTTSASACPARSPPTLATTTAVPAADEASYAWVADRPGVGIPLRGRCPENWVPVEAIGDEFTRWRSGAQGASMYCVPTWTEATFGWTGSRR